MADHCPTELEVRGPRGGIVLFLRAIREKDYDAPTPDSWYLGEDRAFFAGIWRSPMVSAEELMALAEEHGVTVSGWHAHGPVPPVEGGLALLRVLAEADRDDVLEHCYDVRPDGDAPVEEAIRSWREAGYPGGA